jgi:hypothetical protein
MTRATISKLILLLLAVALGTACATLRDIGRLVQPPRFEEARDQPAEVRLLGPEINRPAGGAVVRLWTRVRNPNPFGVHLTTLRGTLFLENARAATSEFPLGLPLGAGEESVVPLDLSISFLDVPGLADVVRLAAAGDPVGYRLEGTIGVDAGQLGQPTFGPMTFLSGRLRTGR